MDWPAPETLLVFCPASLPPDRTLNAKANWTRPRVCFLSWREMLTFSGAHTSSFLGSLTPLTHDPQKTQRARQAFYHCAIPSPPLKTAV